MLTIGQLAQHVGVTVRAVRHTTSVACWPSLAATPRATAGTTRRPWPT